jgi:hypothetical protein
MIQGQTFDLLIIRISEYNTFYYGLFISVKLLPVIRHQLSTVRATVVTVALGEVGGSVYSSLSQTKLY